MQSIVAVLACTLALSTALYDWRDPSAFFFPEELAILTAARDTLWCWVQPIEGGAGNEEMQGISFSMSEVMDILTGSATQMSTPADLKSRLRDKMTSSMRLAFDSLFFYWFNELSGRPDVKDTFLGMLFPSPVGGGCDVVDVCCIDVLLC